jgi:hypothetical protein
MYNTHLDDKNSQYTPATNLIIKIHRKGTYMHSFLDNHKNTIGGKQT